MRPYILHVPVSLICAYLLIIVCFVYDCALLAVLYVVVDISWFEKVARGCFHMLLLLSTALRARMRARLAIFALGVKYMGMILRCCRMRVHTQ
jgi:hypothetical protein